MFAVKLEALYQAHGDLRKVSSRMNRAIEELNATCRRLMDDTDMEIPFKKLTALRTRLEEHLFVAGQMTQALERTAETYRHAEERIIDSSENTPVRSRQYQWKTNDLSGVRKTLDDITFM